MMILPFLPEAEIEGYFYQLKRDLSDENFNKLMLFIFTFEREWMSGVTPARFSVYKIIYRWTKIFELYAARLNIMIGVDASEWDFVSK